MLGTPEERLYAERFVKEALRRLGLGDWTVYVEYKRTRKYRAMVEVIEGAKLAHLTLTSAFFEDGPVMKVWTIAHECCHIHTSQMCQMVEGCFSSYVGEANWDSAYYGFQLSEEQCVDNLAKVLIKILPEWKFPPEEVSKTPEAKKKAAKTPKQGK